MKYACTPSFHFRFVIFANIKDYQFWKKKKKTLPFFSDEQHFQNHSPTTIMLPKSTHVCLCPLRATKITKKYSSLLALNSDNGNDWEEYVVFGFLKPPRVNFVNSHSWWVLQEAKCRVAGRNTPHFILDKTQFSPLRHWK